MIKRLTAIVLSLVLCMCMFAVPTNAADSSNVAEAQNDEVKVIKGEDTGISTVDFQRGGWGMSKVDRSVYTDSSCVNRVEDCILPAGVGFSIVEETSGAFRIDTYSDINVYLCGVWITKGNLTLDFSTACAASIIGNAVSVYGGVGTTNYEKITQVEYFDVVVLSLSALSHNS